MTANLEKPPTPAQPPSDGPPVSLAELRKRMIAIARGEVAVSLGPKARAALERIMDMQGSPALLSITALAEVLKVNPSTLTRLAHSLGYSGFPAFQRVLLSPGIDETGQFYSRHARVALEGSEGTVLARTARLCQENQDNIGRFLAELDPEAFTATVECIMSAPRVAIYGIRQFHAMASFLAYGLRMIRSDVSLIDANNLGTAEGLALLSPGDVLISASCAPYSAQVVAVAQAARRIGLSTVAITDRASSPLIETSQAALLVPHESSFLSNSLGAFIVAAECLINACAAARPEQSREALRMRDQMIDLLDIELPPVGPL